jgi:tetratricopeptide (TPR) repeat protein
MDLYFQGTAWFNKGPTHENMALAGGFFERALALDPKNIEALVGSARVNVATGANVLTDDGPVRLAAAETAALKALSLDPQHARAHMYLGAVHILTGRASQGIAECEEALVLDRNLANAHAFIGFAKLSMGRGAETGAHIEEAFRLSPRDNFAFLWMVYAGVAKLQLGADAEAIAWFRRCIEANRNYPLGYFHLASALARLGSLEEARAAVQAGLVRNPGFTLRRLRARPPSASPAHHALGKRIYEGMRIAGVPEG